MWIIIESYPEFEQDVEQVWKEVIEKYHFKVSSYNEAQVDLINASCKVSFFLETDQRMGFIIENPKTGVIYTELALHSFYDLNFLDRFDRESEGYPLSEKQWLDFIREDNYRAICLVDLPIIMEEILKNWLSLVEGDFSREKEYLKWKQWRDQPHNKGKSSKKLSFNNYKSEMDR